MASKSLGTLTLDLVAKIGGFTAGLNQAERESAKSAAKIQKNIESIGVAGVAVGTALGQGLAAGIRLAVDAFPALIDQAAQFQDIADKTGGSAEGFANFAVSAKVAGVEMETIATASTKLSKALFSIDEESKGAAEGLKAIGVDLQTLKALKPDEQIKLVAQQFGQYADGANKAAAAQLIFGKNGAELLKFFKDYTDSGGDVNILTAEMIQKSDDFLDAQTRLRTELGLIASALATNFIDPLNALIKVIKDGIAEVYGLDTAASKVGANNAVRQFAEDTGRALAGAIDYVTQSVREFQALVDFVITSAKAVRQVADLNFAGAAQTGADFRQKYGLDELGRKMGGAGQEAAKSFVSAYDKELARTKNDRNRAALNAINYGTGGDNRPQIRAPAPRGGGGGGGRRSSAERVSEAQRYLESLQKQLEKTQELSTVEQVLLDIQKGRLGIVSEGQKAALLDVAAQIDASKQLTELEKERVKAEQERLKAQKALMDEGAALTEANRAPLEVFIDQNKRAKELLDAGAISADTYSRQVKKIGEAFLEADQPVKDALTEWDEIQKNFAENIQKTIGDGLVGIMEGNFKDIGSNFAKMLQRMAADALAADIARKLFGSSVKGGEGDGWISSLLSSFGGSFGFGGARAGGGSVQPGMMYRVNERGPEMFESANGDQYMMPGARGRVHANSGNAGTLNVTYVVPGRIDLQTQTQLAQKTRREQLTVSQRF